MGGVNVLGFQTKALMVNRLVAVISELFDPMAWLVWQASSGKAKFSFLQRNTVLTHRW